MEVERPELVRSYVARAASADAPPPTRVRLTQSGEMWLKPGGRALRFTAIEELAVQEVAFSWTARVRMFPGLSMRVVDSYAGGEGSLEVHLLGLLPITRARGADVSAGEALRYLAELPWVPHAMLANPELEWRELDANTVEVETNVRSRRVAARLEFDAAGDIVEAWCEARPRTAGKTTVPTPWGGRFEEYAVVGSLRIPTRGEVYWELPEGEFVYWRGVVGSLEISSS